MDATLADPLVGVVLDRRYRVDTVLAHGGMSTVYSGWDLRLDRPVAVKVMSQAFARDPAFARQFVQEARSAARLSHPNVVSVFDQGQDGDRVFLVMELVRGNTLRALLREQAPMSCELAVAVLEPVLAALDAAHRAGLVHRDVKPENVLICADGTVKVVDFGLARAVASTAATQTGAVLGTVAYVAPEVVSHGSADTRSDVYSAGILLYEMLAGAPPYVGDSAVSVAYRHVHEDVPAPSASVSTVPAELDDLVRRATARAPEDRFPDAGAFLAALRTARATLGLATVAVPAPPELVTCAAASAPGTDNAESTEVLVRTKVLGPPASVSAGRAPAPSRPRPAGPGQRTSVLPKHDEQRAHRRRGILGLVTIVLLGVAAGGLGWSSGMWRNTTVPVLKGLTRAEAVEAVQRAHLRVREETSAVFDEEVRPGLVAGSEPGQGRRVMRNRAVTLLISRGPAPRTVPDLAGRSPNEALQALADLRLKTTVAAAFSPEQPGRVAGTDPAAGSTVDRGATVTVLVSKGRLPDTTGEDQDDAVSDLQEAGLTVNVQEEVSDDVPEGHVISQDPSGGMVREGAQVTIVVSQGPEVIQVPNVIGSDVDDARERLEELGFRVQVRELLGGRVGRVVAQAPIGGVKARRGSVVRLGAI